MGMANVETYPVPKVRRYMHSWRVTWCSVSNQLWYRDFYDWNSAIDFATKG